MVREQLINHISKGETNYTWPIVEYNMRKMLKDIAINFRDHYCFKEFLGR